jgi:hypothetical protein
MSEVAEVAYMPPDCGVLAFAITGSPEAGRSTPSQPPLSPRDTGVVKPGCSQGARL